MSHRTTVLMDAETREAARDLAHEYGCSTSEAIRRSVLSQHEALLGVSEARYRERTAVLERLFELFEGHDAEAEVRRLKEEDEGF